MKKQNKLYKKLRGRKTPMGRAFYGAHHAMKSLRSMFGHDPILQDAADNFNLPPGKKAYFLVTQLAEKWNKFYRTPKLSGLFRLFSVPRSKPVVPVLNQEPE